MRSILGAVLMMGLVGLGEAAITVHMATRTKSLQQGKNGAEAGDFVISFTPATATQANDFVKITAGQDIFEATATAGASVCKVTSDGTAVGSVAWGTDTKTTSARILQIKLTGVLAATKVAAITCTGNTAILKANPTAGQITMQVQSLQNDAATQREAANALANVYSTVATAQATRTSAVPVMLGGGAVPASFSWIFKPTNEIVATNSIVLTASVAMFAAAGTTTTCKAYSTNPEAPATQMTLEIPITSKTVDATKKVLTVVMNPSAITAGSFLDSATPVLLGYDFKIECTDNLAANPATGTTVTGVKVTTTTDTVEGSFADYTTVASVTFHGATREKSIQTGKTQADGGDFVFWFTPETATLANNFVTITADQNVFKDHNTANFICRATSDGANVAVAAPAGDDTATTGISATVLVVKLTGVLAAGKVAAISCGEQIMADTTPAAAAVKFSVKTGTSSQGHQKDIAQSPKLGYTIAADAGVGITGGVVVGSAVPNTLVTGATPASFTWTFNPTNNILPTNEITLTASIEMFTAAGTTMTCTAKSVKVTTGATDNAVPITSNTVDATKKIVTFKMAPTAIASTAGTASYLDSASPIVVGHPLVLSCTTNLAANGATAATITGVKVKTTTDTVEKSFANYAIAAAPPPPAATGNATGNATATKNVAKTLTGSYTKVVQVVTFTKLDAATYSGNVQLTYECAYLDMLDATYCVDVSGSISWLTGVAIDSKAVAARRAGAKVTFTAAVSTTLKSEAQLKTLVATKTANIATAFLAAFNAINANTGFGISNDFGTVTAAAASFTSSTSGAGVLVPSVMAGVAALVASLVM